MKLKMYFFIQKIDKLLKNMLLYLKKKLTKNKYFQKCLKILK